MTNKDRNELEERVVGVLIDVVVGDDPSARIQAANVLLEHVSRERRNGAELNIVAAERSRR